MPDATSGTEERLPGSSSDRTLRAQSEADLGGPLVGAIAPPAPDESRGGGLETGRVRKEFPISPEGRFIHALNTMTTLQKDSRRDGDSWGAVRGAVCAYDGHRTSRRSPTLWRPLSWRLGGLWSDCFRTARLGAMTGRVAASTSVAGGDLPAPTGLPPGENDRRHSQLRLAAEVRFPRMPLVGEAPPARDTARGMSQEGVGAPFPGPLLGDCCVGKVPPRPDRTEGS